MATKELIRGLPPSFQVQLDQKTPAERRAHLAEMARVERRDKRKHDRDRASLIRDEGWDIGPYDSIYDIYWRIEEEQRAKQSGAYALLGFEPNTDPSKRDLRNAYRRKARKLHPDVGGNDEAFREMHAAYRALLKHAKN